MFLSEPAARFDLVASAYAARTADLVAHTAVVLGEEQVATAATERAATRRNAWWRNYGGDAPSSQTAAAMAICFDLAPTIWERWDALLPDGSVVLDALGQEGENPDGSGSMVSFNHYAYGAVAEWLHTTVAGISIDPADPGYHHVFIEPRPGGGLTHASASLATRYGRVSVQWSGTGAEIDALMVEVPPNTSATVLAPNREPVRLGSGTHHL